MEVADGVPVEDIVEVTGCPFEVSSRSIVLV